MGLSTFLSSDQVTQLRGLAWLALSDTGQVGTNTSTSDSGGGATQAWAYATAIPCRVDPLAGNETLVAGRISDRSTHLITTPPRTVVTVNSRFKVTNGGTYEVTAVRSRTGDELTFFEAVQVS